MPKQSETVDVEGLVSLGVCLNQGLGESCLGVDHIAVFGLVDAVRDADAAVLGVVFLLCREIVDEYTSLGIKLPME